MIQKILIVAALICCFVICLAVSNKSNGKLNGKWYGTLTTADGGQYPLNYDFKAKSGKLSGVASSPKGSIVDGQIAGDEFTFIVPVNGSDVQHTCIYYGQADSIGMDIIFNGKNYTQHLKGIIKVGS